MVYVFTICVDANEAFGFRLVEERRRSPVNSSEVEIRMKVGAIRPSMAQSLRMLTVGDVLFQVGYKSPEMKTWQWELVTGFCLEDVMAAITEAKNHDGLASLRFYRPDRKPDDAWTSSFGEDLLVESSIKREENSGERKMGDNSQEPSSVRVGQDFQCVELPQTTKDSPKESNGKQVDMKFSCTRISPGELDQYLSNLFGTSASSETLIELALHCVHECDYDLERATNRYKELVPDATKEWSEDQKKAFETAMTRVGCRDFHAVQHEMMGIIGTDEPIPIGDIVSHYYGMWKSNKAQYEAWTESVANTRNAHPRKCCRCGGDDPYLDTIKCSRCHRHCHLECLDPPMVRIMQSASSKWANWLCENCARPPPKQQQSYSSKHASGTQKPSLVSTSSSPPAPPPSSSTSPPLYATGGRRSAAAAASNILAAVQLDNSGWGRRATAHEDEEVDEEELEDEDDEDDYEDGPRRRGKRSRRTVGRRSSSSRADPVESGPKIHHLKGTPIPVEPLLQIVTDKGGYDAVVSNKLWQVIRKEMNLPHTTSSSTQLRDAYLSYAGFFAKQRGEAGPGHASSPPPPPPPPPPAPLM